MVLEAYSTHVMPQLGGWPYYCQTCGVKFTTTEELADPRHHEWPRNPGDPYAEDT